MKLKEVYSGAKEPFEGDRTLWLNSLPEGASATRARLTLRPVQAPGGTLFRETIHFSNGQGDWGATKTMGANHIEVDFHARRTLLKAVGTGKDLSLQVDMGGAFVGVDENATFNINGADAWLVDLGATDDNLPTLNVSRFRLTEAGAGSASLNLTDVHFRSVPSNLQVRLGQMPPFWVRLGELTGAETSADFAEVLNFFLSSAEGENGFLKLPLVIHSDTLARLEVTLEVTYVIEQPVLPPHLSEVNMAYGFSTLPEVGEGLLTARLPRGAVPVRGRNRAQILGAFEPSRLALGEPGENPSSGVVTVSPQCSLAQTILAEKEIALAGIDLPLANTRPGLAGLHLSLVEDADGKPSGEVLASAEVEVGKPLPDGSVWGSAILKENFRFLPGVRHWLVLQSRSGEAYWSVNAQPGAEPTLQCSRDGGLSWRAAGGSGLQPPLGALYRLRHVPERFTLPVQLQIGTGAGAVRRRLDEFAPAGKVEFSFDFADKLEENLQQPGTTAPCDQAPPLCNGDFALPRPGDATRLLFGVDAASDWRIRSPVDLSRGINLQHERFIVLSIDGSAPRRIDCAGANPQRTSLEEIVAAINRAAGAEVASQTLSSVVSGAATFGPRLQLTSPRGDAGNLTLHRWCELGLPECWGGTALRIHRLRAGAGDFALVLADGGLVEKGFALGERTLHLFCFAEQSLPSPPEPGAVLRQKFRVSPQCTYVMSLSHRILAPAQTPGERSCKPEALEAPSWAVEWFDEEGTSLQVDGAHLEVAVSGKRAMAAAAKESLLAPPPKAASAELRISHPASSGYGLMLERLNLQATAQEVKNSDFSRWELAEGLNLPADWVLESGWTEEKPGNGVLLRGDGPQNTLLVQQAAVSAEADYRLEVQAMASPPSDDGEQLAVSARPRLELAWRQNEGFLGEDVILPLDLRGFPSRRWQGKAPAGADQVEVRLVLPQGAGELSVARVSLEKLDLLDVPMTFLGESPGQLKVSDLRVTYDLPETSADIRTESRLAAPGLDQGSANIVSFIGLAERPTAVLSGIGRRYSEALERRGLRTVGQLAAFEGHEIEGIPATRMLELRAAAELALEYADRITFNQALAARPLAELMADRPAELARLGGLSLEQARQLQQSLRAQYYLIENRALEKMTLADLAGSRSEASEPPE